MSSCRYRRSFQASLEKMLLRRLREPAPFELDEAMPPAPLPSSCQNSHHSTHVLFSLVPGLVGLGDLEIDPRYFSRKLCSQAAEAFRAGGVGLAWTLLSGKNCSHTQDAFRPGAHSSV